MFGFSGDIVTASFRGCGDSEGGSVISISMGCCDCDSVAEFSSVSETECMVYGFFFFFSPVLVWFMTMVTRYGGVYVCTYK